ncbi:hypothetical protein EL84_05630 [Paenibacillus sp. VT-400]|uniref:hypothetical protein n=1 Tax=Paenibacillus sp. VT-400 TaxID=1495853 RepID=UPI00064AFDFB|nr:hypothetical protein [Paenibacillus sp. VT-400]KLU57942.1 hypothetical protein EL84_05630 [Paenibacillus sp. VT-400]
MFKKFMAVVLSVTLLGSSSAFAATDSTGGNTEKQEWQNTSEVILQGELVGTKVQDVSYIREVDSEGEIKVTLTTNTHYDLLPTASEEQREVLQDDIRTDIIEATKDNELLLNGEEVTDEANLIPNFASKSVTSPTAFAVAANDKGGIPSVCHYYGNFTNYSYGCYNGVSVFGNPKGSNVQKSNIPISNTYATRAQTTIDTFQINYNSMTSNLKAFVGLTGLTIIGIETIIGAVVAGGAAGKAASDVYGNYNDANDNLKKAYGYISSM